MSSEALEWNSINQNIAQANELIVCRLFRRIFFLADFPRPRKLHNSTVMTTGYLKINFNLISITSVQAIAIFAWWMMNISSFWWIKLRPFILLVFHLDRFKCWFLSSKISFILSFTVDFTTQIGMPNTNGKEFVVRLKVAPGEDDSN